MTEDAVPQLSRRPGRPVPRSSFLAIGLALTLAGIFALAALTLWGRGTTPPPASRDPNAVVPPADPLAWADLAWAQVPDADNSMSGVLSQAIDRVVVAPGGLVAAGSTSIGVPGSETNVATVWISETGEAWRAIAIDPGGAPGDTAAIQALAAGPAGIVAWGDVCCTRQTGAIWWSADGVAWQRTPLPAGFGQDAFVSRLAAGPDGFVAVGEAGGRMAIWASRDGRAWSAVHPDAGNFIAGTMSAVARDDDGWIAVGWRGDRPTHDGVVWRSTDLATWHIVTDEAPLSGPDEVELFDISPFAGGYLLVGNLGTQDERRRCEQLTGFGDGQFATAGRVALSCGWGVQTHWRSPDGRHWQLLPPIVPQPGAGPLPVIRPDGRGLVDRGPIRAGGPGLVTIGYEIGALDGRGDVKAVWTTADGRTWEPVGRAPQFGPDTSVADIAVVGRRIIAVGSTFMPGDANDPNAGDGQDGAVWIGTVLP
jgi:hypothetical protein